MKREIQMTLNDSDKEYLRLTTIDLLESEQLNDGVFGDETKLKKLQKFNNLETWKKNLLILYSKYNSAVKLQELMNVKKSTILSVIKEIKAELNE